jgi:hypothetical protein
VKSEPKAFASLSSGLLARKGAARPAMRPQGFGQATGNLDDLGWNDMGFEPPKPSSTPLRDVHAAEEAAARVPFAGLTPLESPVHSQQAEIVDRLASIGDPAQQFDEEPEKAAAPVDFAAKAAEVAAEQADFAAPEVEDFAPEQEAYVPTLAEQQIAIPRAAEAEPAVVIAPAPKAVAAPSRGRAPKVRSAAGPKGKAAFTLRLDPERHLKLRLACAVGARSAQQLVTDALDQLLASMPELDAMAENAKRKGS